MRKNWWTLEDYDFYFFKTCETKQKAKQSSGKIQWNWMWQKWNSGEAENGHSKKFLPGPNIMAPLIVALVDSVL